MVVGIVPTGDAVEQVGVVVVAAAGVLIFVGELGGEVVYLALHLHFVAEGEAAVGPVVGVAVVVEWLQAIVVGIVYLLLLPAVLRIVAVAYLLGDGETMDSVELEKVDIKELRKQSDYIYALSIQLDSIDDQQEINRLLRKAVTDLGLPSVFGDNTIDECMHNPNWILKF